MLQICHVGVVVVVMDQHNSGSGECHCRYGSQYWGACVPWLCFVIVHHLFPRALCGRVMFCKALLLLMPRAVISFWQYSDYSLIA